MTELDSIIEGCKEGNGNMQRELYQRYSPRFYALCRRYAETDADAEDILVEGFTTIFSQIEHYRGEGSFEGWMQTIFVRRAMLYYRRATRRREHEEKVQESRSRDSLPEIDKHIDVQRAVEVAMRRLNNKERLIFNMVAVEGYLFADVAEMQGKPVSTIKSQYYRVQRQMQRWLRRSLGRDYLNEYER